MPLVTWGPRSTLGSKGFDLYRCILLGANVPEFRIIPVGYDRRRQRKGMDPGLRADLEQALDELGGTVAVRSSCVDEDTSGGSNAGRYRTVLNVSGIDALKKAVEKVWRSANGSDIAVIVQRQLHPDIAGVLFTIDPVTMEDRTVIEYVKGMCNGLVQGRRDPKRLVIEKDDGSPQPFDELVHTARRLALSFGYPLDIEWAICHGDHFILQARPITALKAPSPRSGRTYSRVQAEQFNSGPVSPLYFSFFKTLHEIHFLKNTLEKVGIDIYREGSIVRHKDHLYFDTRYMEYAISKIPAGDRLSNMVPEDIRGKTRAIPDPLLVLRVLKLLIFNPDLWIWNLDKRFEEEVAPMIVSRLRGMPEFADLSDPELADAYSEIVDIAALHISRTKWGLALYSIPLAHRSSGRIGPCKTIDATRSLEGLADIVRSSPSLMKEAKDGPLDPGSIIWVDGGELFLDAFNATIMRFGHRRLARDLIQPSWREDPQVPLSMVRKMALRPKVRERMAVKNHRDRPMTRYADRYAAFREDQRFYLDMVFSKARELFLEIGTRMVNAGVLHDGRDIFFLDVEDAISWLRTGEGDSIAEKAAFNRLSFDPERPMPGRYMRLGVDFDSVKGGEDAPNSDGGIAGEAISPGSYRGRVRVLHHADEGFGVERGNVVVAKALDPGQSHILSLAGALILEVGGTLSHGAILARERGIPTVGHVKDATRILYDGQTVMVDGSRGYIHITGP